MHRIDSVETRMKLKARHEPYFVRLSAGCYLGFRRLTPTSTGTWIARYRDAATGKQTKGTLGDFEDLAPSKRYDAAKQAAEKWFEARGKDIPVRLDLSVKAACSRYVEHIRATKGETPAKDQEARYRRHVDADPIGAIELPDLNRNHVRAWRARLEARPVVVGPRDKERKRPRSASALNRDMTALRAALNYAESEGHVSSDHAWASVLKPVANADKRRDVYLDRDDRRRLIDNAPKGAGNLLRGLALMPLRPGALAALTVAHFDAKFGVLTIGKDKAGGDRRIRLPVETTKFFAEQAKDKLPAAPLVARPDGAAWGKDAWKKPVKAAAKAAGLPARVTAYSLRHSVISDLVAGGLDMLTVAQLSGTSVAMIEKHYGHLLREHATQALAALAI